MRATSLVSASTSASTATSRASAPGDGIAGPGVLETADDATLARALIAGDGRAPRIVWDRFGPTVYRILRRTFGPRFEIEDVQQDIFMALFRKIGSLRQPESLKAFLLSITARTIKYQLRRKRALRLLHFWSSAENVDNVKVDPPDVAMRGTLASFYAVLDRLSAPDRTVFAMRFLEGMELAQVASAMGTSVSTAKRRLARIWKLVAVRVRADPGLAALHAVAPTAGRLDEHLGPSASIS